MNSRIPSGPTRLVNFQPCFALLVQSGAKRQTIRRLRKRAIKLGDNLRMYCGLRDKYGAKATFLGEFQCIGVEPVTIRTDGVFLAGKYDITEKAKLDEFARLDGFGDWEEMRRWFDDKYGPLPFVGVVIFW